MTYFLASVRSPAEAELVLGAGADIVDLKDPTAGALGAVAPDVIEDCLKAIDGRKPVSATVGDLPMVPDVVSKAVEATASRGVDTVKLGVQPHGDVRGCLNALRSLRLSADLVLVFFADALPDIDALEAAEASRARGVMLDTASKARGSLIDSMPLAEIELFVRRARRAGLLIGLAGSLRACHVHSLLQLRPDLMGFRGALCEQGSRGNDLSITACTEIGRLIAAGCGSSKTRFKQRATSAMC